MRNILPAALLIIFLVFTQPCSANIIEQNTIDSSEPSIEANQNTAPKAHSKPPIWKILKESRKNRARHRKVLNSVNSLERLQTKYIRVDRRKRSYELYVPLSYNSINEAVPLLILLHGGGGNAKGAIGMVCPEGNTQSPGCLTSIAERENFIIVVPDGTSNPLLKKVKTFNAGNCCGTAMKKNVDDVSFISKLIDHISSEFSIDQRKVFATGISNGALMSYRLACELSDKIAAIAPIAGAIGVPECRPQRPVPAAVFHGTDDHGYPFVGGIGSLREKDEHFISGYDSFNKLARINGCDTNLNQEKLPDKADDGTVVIKESYSNCNRGAEVILYKIIGGGHTWPNGFLYMSEDRIGNVSTDISANELMWEFFKKHPMKK